MKRRTITISFDCDAPDETIQEIAEHMRWQLDSLNDGTLEMEEGVVADDNYDQVKVEVV